MKPSVDFDFPQRFQSISTPDRTQTKTEAKAKTPPVHDVATGDQCPHCHQRIESRRANSISVLVGGFRQVSGGLFLVVFALVRCVRFVAAMALCTVGFLGGCCRTLGMRISHPDDRRILDRL